jgi:arylformamidase
MAMKLIDLTMPLGPETPVYPGDPGVKLQTIADIGSDGYHDTMLTMDTHNGTHIDAPAHMVDGGKTLDHFGADALAGRGVLVDATGKLTGAAFAAVEPGDIVLLRTGASDDFLADDYYERTPTFADGALNELIRRRPKLVGVDAGSVDHEPFEVHKALLGAEILIGENLVGLGALEGQAFEVYALPLRLDVDGSPARIIARVA